MLQIPSRERPCQTIVEGIDGLGHARSLIDGFAERVSNGHVQAPAGMPKARLKRVVIRIADTGVVCVVMEVRPKRSARSRNNFACGSNKGRVFTERSARSRSRS